jgi:thiamine pyrophosphokinase
MRRGYKEFLLLGVIGARLDHTLVNTYIISMLEDNGCHGMIIDDYSEMELVSDTPVLIDDSFPWFSLLNITGTAKGVTVKNAKYPLCDAEITCRWQYGISNEVLPGKTAEVSVRRGELLLLKILHN